MLRRDLTATVLAGDGCTVLTGTLADSLADPCSGRSIASTRGVGARGDVQVDHVLALFDACQKEVEGWGAPGRVRSAGDPLNRWPWAAR